MDSASLGDSAVTKQTLIGTSSEHCPFNLFLIECNVSIKGELQKKSASICDVHNTFKIAQSHAIVVILLIFH